jgi:hypothetical protein
MSRCCGLLLDFLVGLLTLTFGPWSGRPYPQADEDGSRRLASSQIGHERSANDLLWKFFQQQELK